MDQVIPNQPLVETVAGTGPGSVYVVIAKKGEMRLAFCPYFFIRDGFSHVGGRLRCLADPNFETGASFGLELHPRGPNHSSGMMGAPIAPGAVSATEMQGLLDKFNVVHALAAQLVARLTKGDPDIIIDVEVLAGYLQECFNTMVADQVGTYPETLEFQYFQ